MTTTTTIDIDTVCTHAQLVAELLGDDHILTQVLGDSQDSEAVRQRALEETIKRLSRRTPPVLDSELNDVTELRDCVRYGALWKIYFTAMTEGDESALWTRKASSWKEMFLDEVAAVQPSLGGDVRAAAGSPSVAVHRR